jgi:hypothetical protein
MALARLPLQLPEKELVWRRPVLLQMALALRPAESD